MLVYKIMTQPQISRIYNIKQVIGNTLYYCFNFDKKQITNPFRNTKENDIRNTIN